MMREAIIFLSFSCFISYLLLYLFDAKYKRLQRETKDQENPEETVGIMTKENFLSDNSGQDIIDYGSSSDSSSNSF